VEIGRNGHGILGVKLPTPAITSPYLQNITIHNLFLKSWLMINMYMPFHVEDLTPHS
jgi:hypothetical protein